MGLRRLVWILPEMSSSSPTDLSMMGSLTPKGPDFSIFWVNSTTSSRPSRMNCLRDGGMGIISLESGTIGPKGVAWVGSSLVLGMGVVLGSVEVGSPKSGQLEGVL